MRSSVLRAHLADCGATFKARYGVEIPASISNPEAEYRFIRDAVGITDFSSMHKFRIPAEQGIDFLDKIFPGNIARIRFCRVLHTFLADANGHLLADCYIANNDEDFIILCESLVDDAQLQTFFDQNGGEQHGLKNITETHLAISVDGCQAWAVVKELFGSDVLGLPYLSIETYHFAETPLSLIRAGKTSEFGYLLLAPCEVGAKLWSALSASAKKQGGGLCGADIHDTLRLDGRFLNIYAEGARVKDPLALGLQWMIDFDKSDFIGREAILHRRAQGLTHKIVGVKADAAVSGFGPGVAVYDQGQDIASVQAASFSFALKAWVGLVLLPVTVAYPYLQFQLASADGPTIETIAMPPIVPKSLSVKLDDL